MQRGRLAGAVRAFTGIAYAAPPASPLRFRAPQSVRPWRRSAMPPASAAPAAQSNADLPA
ncbi:carboxylesterase family protein [Streptomyces sp. MBT53]|nr:carboxylesterase family protein [Streptomyces sp. MBT53]